MLKLYPTQIRVNGLMTTTVLNTKAKDNEKKYLILKFLATKATLIIKAAAVESKITDITNLATKAALNTKAKEIENKTLDTTNVITTPEFNRLTKISFDSKMREAAKSFANKSQFGNSLDIADCNRKKKNTKL